MATLKEHQAAMVDLLANGSGIPASASRLAHAMHDVLAALHGDPDLITMAIREAKGLSNLDATTPGLNDKALSKREKALKTDSPAKWPTPAEQRVKELENTIRQLKANNAKLREDISCYQAIEASLTARINNVEHHRDAFRADLARTDAHVAELISRLPEQAGCRNDDTQVCEHDYRLVYWASDLRQCGKCGSIKE